MISYAGTNNVFVGEKIISAGFALMVVLLCGLNTIFDTYVVMGYAHIFLAVLYMKKAGKVTPIKALLSVAMVIGLFYLALNFQKEVTIFAAAFLMFHVYAGEMRFIKRPFNLPYLVMTLCLTTVICSWLVARLWHVEINLTMLWVPVLVAGAAGIGCFIYDRGRVEIEMYFLFLVGMLAVLFLLEITGHRPLPVQILGFVILTHYMTYYVHITRRFSKKENRPKLALFSFEALAANLLFLIGLAFVHHGWYGYKALYQYAYAPIGFYVWSLFHFITTFRASEYKDALKLRMPTLLREAYA